MSRQGNRNSIKAGRNDARILCRRLWPSDRAAVEAHILRLDAETRADRFMSVTSDRTALAHAERALVSKGIVFGAFADGVLRGLGELHPVGSRPLYPSFGLGLLAEAAFAVERDFRREGLASALFRRMVEAARSRGVAELHVRFLDANGPMRKLALKLGAKLHAAGGETAGAIRLARPTPLSLWRTGFVEAIDLTLAVSDAAQAVSAGQATMRSTSSSGSNSSSLPAIRPRTEIPAS